MPGAAGPYSHRVNAAAQSVPIIGPSAMFVPKGSMVGSASTMKAMATSRSEQHLTRVDRRLGARVR